MNIKLQTFLDNNIRERETRRLSTVGVISVAASFLATYQNTTLAEEVKKTAKTVKKTATKPSKRRLKGSLKSSKERRNGWRERLSEQSNGQLGQLNALGEK